MLKDARFWELQLEIDRELAQSAREEGCLKCEGVLHSASYRRKPRGGPAGLGEEHDVRFSFCCEEDGCRSRRTPASLRFLGRKVYRSAVVALVAAMRHGANAERMGKLRELLGVSRRTVKRWRAWWQTTFAQSGCYRELASRLLPAVATNELPWSLMERFFGDERERLISFLRALGPITVGSPAALAR